MTIMHASTGKKWRSAFYRFHRLHTAKISLLCIHCTIFTVLLFSAIGSAAPLVYSGYQPSNLDTAYLAREYSRIGKAVGLLPHNDSLPVNIVFYRISEERKTGIRLPEWGGGGALGTDSIVMPVDRQSAFYAADVQRIILHEMVHITLARSYGLLRIPRWFHEGVAMALAGDISFEQQLQLSRAILLQKLVPLDSMEQLNRFSRWRAEVAYSQCHFAVNFLVSTYGLDLLPELLAASQKTRQFETACVKVFGLTIPELQLLLDKKMSTNYRILFVIGDYSLVWGGIFVLAVVAFVVTRIRKRARLRKMAQEDGAEALVGEDPEGAL